MWLSSHYCNNKRSYRSCNHTGICLVSRGLTTYFRHTAKVVRPRETRICLGCEGKQKVHSASRSLLECRCHQYHQSNWSSTRALRMGSSPTDVTSHLFQRLALKGQRIHVDRQNFYFSSRNWRCNFNLFCFYFVGFCLLVSDLKKLKCQKNLICGGRSITSPAFL